MQTALAAFYLSSCVERPTRPYNAIAQALTADYYNTPETSYNATQHHYKPHRIGRTDRTIERREKAKQTATEPHRAIQGHQGTNTHRPTESAGESHRAPPGTTTGSTTAGEATKKREADPSAKIELIISSCRPRKADPRPSASRFYPPS